LVAKPDSDFFEGLETVGHERRAEHGESTDPLFRELGE
jgi:hypothetical protein